MKNSYKLLYIRYKLFASNRWSLIYDDVTLVKKCITYCESTLKQYFSDKKKMFLIVKF